MTVQTRQLSFSEIQTELANLPNFADNLANLSNSIKIKMYQNLNFKIVFHSGMIS